MNFQPNISIINSLIQDYLWFYLLSWSIAKMSRKPWKESYLIISMLAGMKIGEGILRYCPVVDLMNNTIMKKKKKKRKLILSIRLESVKLVAKH